MRGRLAVAMLVAGAAAGALATVLLRERDHRSIGDVVAPARDAPTAEVAPALAPLPTDQGPSRAAPPSPDPVPTDPAEDYGEQPFVPEGWERQGLHLHIAASMSVGGTAIPIPVRVELVCPNGQSLTFTWNPLGRAQARVRVLDAPSHLPDIRRHIEGNGPMISILELPAGDYELRVRSIADGPRLATPPLPVRVHGGGQFLAVTLASATRSARLRVAVERRGTAMPDVPEQGLAIRVMSPDGEIYSGPANASNAKPLAVTPGVPLTVTVSGARAAGACGWPSPTTVTLRPSSRRRVAIAMPTGVRTRIEARSPDGELTTRLYGLFRLDEGRPPNDVGWMVRKGGESAWAGEIPYATYLVGIDAGEQGFVWHRFDATREADPLEVVVPFPAPGARCRIAVRYADGRPVVDQRMRLLRESGTLQDTLIVNGRLGEDGTGLTPPIPVGRYRLQLSVPPVVLPVEIRSDITVTLPRGRPGPVHELSGTVRDAQGAVVGARVEIGRDQAWALWAVTDGFGRFDFTGLAAGRWRIVVREGGVGRRVRIRYRGVFECAAGRDATHHIVLRDD